MSLTSTQHLATKLEFGSGDIYQKEGRAEVSTGLQVERLFCATSSLTRFFLKKKLLALKAESLYFFLNHYLVHEKKKPYIQMQYLWCQLCFRTKLNLYLESVHDEIKPFNCNKCDSSFAQKQHLKMHIQSVHGNKKSYNFFPSWTCAFKFGIKVKINHKCCTSIYDILFSWTELKFAFFFEKLNTTNFTFERLLPIMDWS
jgi:hypothetical protein